MLVLTRKHQEKIRIGENITITILKTKGKAVRVGIEAPAEIAVIRGELVANGEPISVLAESNSENVTAESPVRQRRLRERTAESEWSTQPRPEVGEKSRRRPTTTKVTLQRVPRSSGAPLLTSLAGEGGPLRSMLERRASV
jgi:carbon storage regulator CsrA